MTPEYESPKFGSSESRQQLGLPHPARTSWESRRLLVDLSRLDVSLQHPWPGGVVGWVVVAVLRVPTGGPHFSRASRYQPTRGFSPYKSIRTF
jgi:hypothetical protein